MREFIGGSDPVVHDSASGPETENDGDDIEASARDGNSSKREKSQSPDRDLIAPSPSSSQPWKLPRKGDDITKQDNNRMHRQVSSLFI